VLTPLASLSHEQRQHRKALDERDVTAPGLRRYVRYTNEGQTSYGILDGPTVYELIGDLFENPVPSGRTVEASGVRFEIPVDPDRVQKVISVTGQFSEVKAPPRHPRVFGMLATSLLQNGAAIEIPPECRGLQHAGGIVVVIGTRVPRFTSVNDASDHVFGVAVGNDVTDARWCSEDEGVKQPSLLVGMAADTWAPIGDEIVTGIDYDDLRLTARIDGTTASEVRTSQMNNTVAEAIAYLSEYITLAPGDLLYMSSPSRGSEVLAMKAGADIQIELEGVGVVRNPVVDMIRPAFKMPWPVRNSSAVRRNYDR
jgi:2-keto-4-pentenoate hydratase/2-oxohepta-3-ene-1,7-dioic acid hydratase in catechol pathway